MKKTMNSSMIKSKKIMLIAVLIPVLSLMGLTLYKKSIIEFGTEIVLPISGYDPRDLLSGHYLVYQVDYGVNSICPQDSNNSVTNEAWICLETKSFSYSKPSFCSKKIKGTCRGIIFQAGIERFYIPEEKSKELDAKIREKKASIIVSVNQNGDAVVKDIKFELPH
ncbi:MAG: GDYXXLXY domain-containing protein [Bacteriovoracaceae bacterium]